MHGDHFNHAILIICLSHISDFGNKNHIFQNPQDNVVVIAEIVCRAASLVGI